MTIPYIAPKASLRATAWNELFTELDRKLALLLDGKSPLILANFPSGNSISVDSFSGRTIYPLLGALFYFLGASPNYATGTPYNHDAFRAVAGAATEISRDDATETVKIRQPSSADYTACGVATNELSVLAHSLEAHTRVGYYLWEEFARVPEKTYRYAVAELVFDDFTPYSSFTFPKHYNKYNFFRIHNLQPRELTIFFEGAEPGFSITVPAYGCRAVRRDSVAGPYTYGLNYFFLLKSGDPRLMRPLWSDDDSNSGVTGRFVYGAMQGNNAVNPITLFHWIRTFEQLPDETESDRGVKGVIWYSDRHEWFELGDYSGLFGNPSLSATKLGDLVHHKGKLQYRRSGLPSKTVNFRGYNSIVADFANAGLTVSDAGANLSISAPAGAAQNLLISFGTNLLCGGDSISFTPASSADCGSPLAIDARWPDPALLAPPLGMFVRPIVGTVETIDANYLDDDANPVTVSYDSTKLDEPTVIPTQTLKIWQATVTDALTLNAFGSADFTGTNQETDYCSFQNRRIILTIFGPKILFEKVVYLSAGRNGLDLVRGIGDGDALATLEESGGVVACRSKHVIDWTPCGWGTKDNPAFLTPRKTRRYSKLDRGAHPNLQDDVARPGGEDFTLRSVGKSYIRTSITALCPASIEMPTADSAFGVWDDPDGLYTLMTGDSSAVMPRVFTLSEFFNSLVAAVNALKRGNPLNFRHSHLYIAPNETNVWNVDSGLIPIDQYAAGEFVEIPDALNAGVYDDQFRTEPVRDGNAWLEFPIGANVSLGVEPSDPSYSRLDFPYVSIEQVGNYAQANGFKFIWRKASTPLGYRRLKSPSFVSEGGPSTNYLFPIWTSEEPNAMWRLATAPAIIRETPFFGDTVTLGIPGTSDYYALSDDIAQDAYYNNSVSLNVWAHSCVFYRKAVSEGPGMDSQEAVILLKRSHFNHTATDYSGVSDDNKTRKFLYAAAILPLEGISDEGESQKVGVSVNVGHFIQSPFECSTVLIFEPPVLNLA
jgi:hypothetical protein